MLFLRNHLDIRALISIYIDFSRYSNSLSQFLQALRFPSRSQSEAPISYQGFIGQPFDSIFASESSQSGYSRKCYQNWLISTFELLFLGIYRFDLFHQGFNQMPCIHRGGLDSKTIYFDPCIKILLIRSFHNFLSNLLLSPLEYLSLWFSVSACLISPIKVLIKSFTCGEEEYFMKKYASWCSNQNT